MIIHTSTQGWVIRAVIDDSKPNTGPIDILEELRFQLGLDEGSFQHFSRRSGNCGFVALYHCFGSNVGTCNTLDWWSEKKTRSRGDYVGR